MLGDTIYGNARFFPLLISPCLTNVHLGLKYGIGKHFQLLGPDVYKHFFTGLFVGWILYATTICIVKFSILALYWRVFQYSSIRVPIILLTGVVSCWGIATVSDTHLLEEIPPALLHLCNRSPRQSSNANLYQHSGTGLVSLAPARLKFCHSSPVCQSSTSSPT